jgi:hypothetical protein
MRITAENLRPLTLVTFDHFDFHLADFRRRQRAKMISDDCLRSWVRSRWPSDPADSQASGLAH